MSLILEALKKLERDKQVEGRGGFLVMAARPWPSETDNRRRVAAIVVGAVAMMAVGAGLAVWLVRGSSKPTIAADAAAPATSPAASAPVTSAPAAAVAPNTTPVAIVPAYAPPAAPTSAVPKAAAVAAPQPAAPAAIRASAAAPPDARVVTEPAGLEPREPAHMITAAAATKSEAAAPGGARFRLTAISEREGKPVAMLNDRLVQEGDSFDDVTVVRIGEGEVELKVAGKQTMVRF